MKLGIFGGSFDPIHMGHLILAEFLSQEARLDHVLFVPSGLNPHKRTAPPIDPRHRLAMVRLAVTGHPRFSVSDIEIRKGGPSYTIETIRELSRRYPKNSLFLLMGSDTARDLPKWKEFSSLAATVHFLIATRPGAALPLSVLRRIRRTLIDIPQIGISSSMIRDRLRREESVQYLVPEPVEQYIMKHKLYGHRG